MELPDDLRFEVRAAEAAVAALAQKEPDARIALTIAQIAGGGLEAESEVYLRAEEAAALLGTVADDQSLAVGGRSFFVLRVTRAEPAPPPEPDF